MGDTSLADRLDVIKNKKTALVKIVEKIIIIEREDSLHAIAAMAATDRAIFVKKIVKRLRKEQGLKEEADMGGTMIGFDNPLDNKKNEPTDLFADTNKGEWYFYNSSLKSKGFTDFKRKWGTRRNTDNWRRKNAIDNTANNPTQSAVNNISPNDIDKPADPISNTGGTNKNILNDSSQQKNFSYEALMANIPLTPEKMNVSNTLLAISLFELAQLYQKELEDYEQAVIQYEQSLIRYPDSLYNGELYLGLYFCFTKLKNNDKAAKYKKLLSQNFAGSHSEILLNKPETFNSNSKNTEGTKRYDAIYNLFIEGKFEDALTEKVKADSTYGNNLWTPQLLYIEAVFYIKQRQDSAAIDILKKIDRIFPSTKLAQKANRMIEVLKRRTDIEAYLTKLEITRSADEPEEKKNGKPVLKRDDANLIESPKNFIDTSNKKNSAGEPLKIDSIKITTKSIKDSTKKVITDNVTFTFTPDTPHAVIMVLDRVDGTYINEAKNAMRNYLSQNFYNEPIELTRDFIDKDRTILLFSNFTNIQAAYQFLLKIKKAAPEELSWLPANKYSFYPISGQNLLVLKTNTDIVGYISWLKKNYPVKL